MSVMPAPRVALYSPGMIGLGHMRRNLQLVRSFAALYPAGSFLMLTEAREAGAFDFPDNVDCLCLPALRKDLDGRCAPRRLRMGLDEFTSLRTDVLTAALQRFAPDVLIVDHLPLGAFGEIEPGLELLRQRGRTRCVLGLRDILEEHATVKADWAQRGHTQAIERFYEAVWIYGDPRVFNLATQLPAAVRERARFTGYLNPAMSSDSGAHEEAAGLALGRLNGSPFVLCEVGGGQDGVRLAQTFVDARMPEGRAGVVLTGPFMAREERQTLCRRAENGHSKIHVFDFITEPLALLSRAEKVVAMGGYNSVCEILALRKPALIVPRAAPRREQLIRADRLSRLGCIEAADPEHLSAELISDWLSRPAWPRRASATIDMSGLTRAPEYLQEVIEGRWSAPRKAARAGGYA